MGVGTDDAAETRRSPVRLRRDGPRLRLGRRQEQTAPHDDSRDDDGSADLDGTAHRDRTVTAGVPPQADGHAGEDDPRPAGPAPVVEDQPPPARVRRPADGLQLLVLVAGAALVLVVSSFAPRTTAGLTSDVRSASGLLPAALLALGSFVVVAGTYVLPLAVIVDQLVRREARFIVDALLAGAIAWGAASGLTALLAETASPGVLQSLTAAQGDGLRTPAVPLYFVIAFLTANRLELGRRWGRLPWLLAGLVVVAPVLSRDATPLAAVLGVLVARACGLLVRYVLGRPSLRPWGEAVLAALQRVQLDPVAVRRNPAGDSVSRAYRVETADGRRLDAVVLDRDRQAAGIGYRLYQRARLRGPVNRRAVLSVRQAVDAEALHAYAAHASGARTPQLLAVTDVGPNAAMLVYRHHEGRHLAVLDPGEVDEDLLRAAWAELGILHAARVAHRGLTGGGVLVEPDRRVALVDLRAGEIAATDLQLRLDHAQLLATTALLAGPERAADAALAALGARSAAAIVPLLQPIALGRETRDALRQHRALLPALRERLTAAAPEVTPDQVSLQRLSLRGLGVVIAGGVALYLLLTQLAEVNVGRLLERAEPGWVAAGLAVSVLGYVGAALSLMAFTPGRLPLLRTTMVQVASSFVNLVSPPTVGTSALNARYLQRQDVPLGVAVASVGLTQLAGFVVTLVLLVGCGVATGSQEGSRLLPSSHTLLAIVVLGLVVGLALLVPPVRRGLAARVGPSLRQVVPRLLDVVQQPNRVLLGLGGNLLVTAAYVFCLLACLRAFGTDISVASVTLAYLAGAAVGTAAPTPGGIGAVEAALAASLTAVGVQGDVAVSATLLFRLITFWLRVPPGYVAFRRLGRRHVI